LDNTVAHFTKNASRMRYHALRRQDLEGGHPGREPSRGDSDVGGVG
jgi:hypothetical protein